LVASRHLAILLLLHLLKLLLQSAMPLAAERNARGRITRIVRAVRSAEAM
jgi:hypothetical protein